jgi:hypothetical protein
MNQTRKLGNLIIREGSKKSSRDEGNKTKTSLANENEKKRSTLPKFESNF